MCIIFGQFSNLDKVAVASFLILKTFALSINPPKASETSDLDLERPETSSYQEMAKAKKMRLKMFICFIFFIYQKVPFDLKIFLFVK